MKITEFRKLIKEEIRKVLKEGVSKAELKTMKATAGWNATYQQVAFDLPDSWPSHTDVVPFEEGAKEVLDYATNNGAAPRTVTEIAAKLKELKTKGTKFVLYAFEADLSLGVL